MNNECSKNNKYSENNDYDIGDTILYIWYLLSIVSPVVVITSVVRRSLGAFAYNTDYTLFIKSV